ncbi:hypothetical protein [Rossellomorea sp. LjRoot5]|uniref:hypothetical protein n=1 Tax=Rossellomorea sp. LjRoot5 TaxID=3342331 RepID=UPI003ED09548
MSQQRQRKPINKENPGANGKHFIAFPSDAKHYVHHPRMAPEKLFLYQLLIDYYNVDKGYAHPSLETLTIHYGKSYNTTVRHIEDLKVVGLLDYPKKGYYVPLQPLTADEFYADFPEAWERYKKAYDSMEGKKSKDKTRMQEWRREQGYDD